VVEPRCSTAHLRPELEQTSERSLQFAPELEILLGNHARTINPSAMRRSCRCGRRSSAGWDLVGLVRCRLRCIGERHANQFRKR